MGYIQYFLKFVVSLSIIIPVLYLILYICSNIPYDYDEFYNLQIPLNFAKTGLYASTVNCKNILFDPFISTGPAVLIPISILFKFFSYDYNIARFYMIINFYAFCYITFIFTRKLTNLKGGIAAAFFVLLIAFMPRIITLPYVVLGEIPASFFFLIGIYLYYISEEKKSKSFLLLTIVGIFIGLSVLCKLIFILSIIPLFFIIAIKKKYSSIYILFGYCLPIFFWEIYQILVIKEYYFQFKIEQYQALFSQGATTNFMEFLDLTDKLQLIGKTFSISLVLLIFFLVTFACFLAVFLHYNYKKNKDSLVVYLLFIIISILVWLFFIKYTWSRHFISYYLLSIPILIKMLFSLHESSKKESKTRIKTLFLLILFINLMIICISAVSIINNLDSNINKNYKNLTDQKLFINECKNNISKERIIGYIGWYKTPEISFFLNNKFVDLDQMTKNGVSLKPNYLITCYYDPRNNSEIINAMQGKLLIESPLGRYKLYTINDGYSIPLLLYSPETHWNSTPSWGDPIQFTSINGKLAIFEHPLGKDEVTVTYKNIIIKENSWLTTSIGLDPNSWNNPNGTTDGVTFHVRVIDDGKIYRLLDTFIPPHQEFTDVNLSLTRFIGKKIDLQFLTNVGPDGNGNSDWAYWIYPIISNATFSTENDGSV